MPAFIDALRGYAFETHKRDKFICQYCGLDGSESFEKWLSLSIDHLLPKGHPLRDKPDYLVTACMFCNTADNRYFSQAKKRGLVFDGRTPAQLVEQRKEWVERTRKSYREFWEDKVKKRKA